MGFNSRPVQQTIVYPQSTQPTDERDGVLWVDTSVQSRPLRVYSSDTGGWEPVAGDTPVLVTQEAVSFAETGVTVTTTDAAVQDGTVTLDYAASEWTESFNGTVSYTEAGEEFNPNVALSGITGDVASNSPSGVDKAVLKTGYNGTVLAEDTSVSGPGDTFTLEADLSPGTTYAVGIHNPNGTSRAAANHVYNLADFDVTTGWYLTSGSYTTNQSYMNAVDRIKGLPVDGEATVSFDSIPTDLAGWDLFTWQKEEGDGGVAAELQVNDGSGWTTLAADAVAPYDISSVSADSDVRVVLSLTAPATGSNVPAVPYVARRGER